MIASQPSNADCETSLTNVWSEEFVAMMQTFLREQGVLPAAAEVELYEHYIDPSVGLDRVRVDPEAEIVWSAVAQGEGPVREAFEVLVGPMPQFESFKFADAVERFRSELTKESRQSELAREVERARRASGSIDADS
jgi:hypothetical protein